MPHYFFHLHNGEGWVHDREGRDQADLAAVERTAADEARAMIAADVADGTPILLGSFIAVDDDKGNEVARVLYDSVVSFAWAC